MGDRYKIAVSKYALDSKIPQGQLDIWNRFNRSFANQELEDKHVLQAICDGRAITTPHRDNWRHSRNYLCGQHLGLDFDNGDQASTLPALIADKFIARYAAFVHTTISHTDEAPRARAIFFLDQPIIQPQNYALAATALVWLYGGLADRKCKDPARFFYGALGCKYEYLGNVLPLDVIKRLIANYQESGRVEKKRATRSDYTAPASQQEVYDALQAIPPWQIDYDEWVAVLMAIHAEFGDAGLSMAESWGDGQPGEVERKWQSFHNDGNPQGAVTIATLFHLAKGFGWRKELVHG
jgi:hypothetical protein